MKSLSVIVIASLSILMTILSITPISCNKDKCKTTTCANGGVCNGGSCTCASGYEGTNCETISRAKFLGNWSQSESSSVTSPGQFSVSAQAATGITNLIIKNFNNSFTQYVSAYVSNKDSLIIPIQGLQGKIVEGYCYFANSNNIIVHYDITDSVTKLVTTINTKW